MDAIQDFVDLLALFQSYRVRYLIIGGLAFIYHAKPRFTKDIDLWVQPEPDNIRRANQALTAFGSPFLLQHRDKHQIVQIGLPPHRIDLLLNVPGLHFLPVWRKRIRGRYGSVAANWIDLDSLIRAKQRIPHPRHQDDVRVLRQVKRLRHARRVKHGGGS